MAVEILSSGAGVGNSATVTVTNTPVTVGITMIGGIVKFIESPPLVQMRVPDGSWVVTGILLDHTKPFVLLNAPGDYRVRRLPNTEAYSVFRSDP